MPYLKVQSVSRACDAGEPALRFYRKLKGDFSCMLEGVDDGNLSIIGFDPFMKVECEDGVVSMTVLKNEFGYRKSRGGQIVEGKSLEVLYKLIRSFDLRGKYGQKFCGGAAGYFSYDFLVGFNGFKQKVYDARGVPDFCFYFYDKAVLFDTKAGRMELTGVAETDAGCERKLGEIEAALAKPMPLKRKPEGNNMKPGLSAVKYQETVNEIKQLLAQDGVDWVNYCHNYSAEYSGSLVEIYELILKKVAEEKIAGFMLDESEHEVASLLGGVPLSFKEGSIIGGSGWGPLDMVKMSNKNYLEYFVPNLLHAMQVGDPKAQAVRILDKVEDFKRGLFGAAAGFISFSGEAAFYPVLKNCTYKDGKVNLQFGNWINHDYDAGDVYDIDNRMASSFLFQEQEKRYNDKP